MHKISMLRDIYYGNCGMCYTDVQYHHGYDLTECEIGQSIVEYNAQ